MCDVKDVLEASRNSADVIVSAIYDFGGNNLGEGIRKLAQEMFNIGTQTGYEQGYVTGSRDGFIKGTLVSMGEISLLGLIVWGINKISEKSQADKTENAKTENSEAMEGKRDE